MKKIFIIILLLCAKVATAQELQFMTSTNTHRVAFEYMNTIKNHTIYGYSEVGINDSVYSYTQIYYEYSIVKYLSIHAEYRNMLFNSSRWQNTFIVGCSVPVLGHKYGYISLCPLYRYDRAHMWQATAAYGFNYKFITFDGYFDLYGDRRVNAYSENKLKFHIDRFFVGVNIEYSLSPSHSLVTPYILVGVKFN